MKPESDFDFSLSKFIRLQGDGPGGLVALALLLAALIIIVLSTQPHTGPIWQWISSRLG